MNIEILNTLEIKKKEIDYHNQKYHSDDNQEINDFEFDQLCKEYDDIITANPEFYFLRVCLNGISDNYIDKKYNVQITDLDESGFTDLLITSDDTSYWLHTKLLKNKISFPVSDNFSMGIFASDAEDDIHFYSVHNSQKISIESGEITEEMFSLEGLQLYQTQFLIGIIVALLSIFIDY